MKNNIIICGDSIVYGVGDNPEKGGWANRLKSIFDQENNGKTNKNYVHSIGFPGAKTTDIVARFENICEALHFEGTNEIIIFSIGVNDTQFNGKQISADALQIFEENIRKLIDIAKRYSKNILFAGLTRVRQDEDEEPFKWKDEKFFDNRIIGEFDARLKDICSENACVYISTANLLSSRQLKDGLHPNEIGHFILCNEVNKKIKELYIQPEETIIR